MSPNALGTIRAITFLREGKTEILCAAIRLPVGENTTDNFSYGKSGNIGAPIDLKTGIIGTAIGSENANWPAMVDIKLHPDTGKPIEGFKIPYWEDTIDLIQRAHESLPLLPTIGWDIAITDDGPCIVEANSAYNTGLIQASHRKGYLKEIKDFYMYTQRNM